MITIYHLGVSQSDRVVWLMEELGLPYELQWFDRGANGLAQADYRALHPVATAPTIRDGDLVLCDSLPIVEYLINRHGDGRFGVRPDKPNYADYLYWMAFGGSFQGNIFLKRTAAGLAAATDHEEAKRIAGFAQDRENRYLAHLEQRLGEQPWLAGPDFTACEIMNAFNFTTWKRFGGPVTDHLPNISAWIARFEQRPAYREAMAIAGPGATKPPGARLVRRAPM